MNNFTDEQILVLKNEWLGFGCFVLKDDLNTSDHAEIDKWIMDLLSKKSRSKEDEYVVHCINHACTSDIPFKATASIRAELLSIVRMKIKDPDWRRFPL